MFTCLLRAASITNSMRHCAAYIGLTVDGANAESANDARTERVRRSVNRRTIRRLLSQRVESIRQHVLQHSDPHGYLEEELVKDDRAVTENRHGVNDDDDGDRELGCWSWAAAEEDFSTLVNCAQHRNFSSSCCCRC